MALTRRVVLTLFSLSVSCSFFYAGTATAKVVVVASKIEKLLDEDLRGAFARYLLATLEEADIDADIRIVPSKRADAIFNNRKADIRFPEFNPPARTTDSVPSLYWGSIKRFAFTKKPVSPPLNAKELAGHKILLVNNYRYGLDYQSLTDQDIHFTPSETSSLNMLMHGRGSVMIAVTREVVPLSKKQGIYHQLNYAPDHPIEQKNLAIAVQDTAPGLGLLKRLNQAIRTLSDSGKARTLLGPGLFRELTAQDIKTYRSQTRGSN